MQILPAATLLQRWVVIMEGTPLTHETKGTCQVKSRRAFYFGFVLVFASLAATVLTGCDCGGGSTDSTPGSNGGSQQSGGTASDQTFTSSGNFPATSKNFPNQVFNIAIRQVLSPGSNAPILSGQLTLPNGHVVNLAGSFDSTDHQKFKLDGIDSQTGTSWHVESNGFGPQATPFSVQNTDLVVDDDIGDNGTTGPLHH
jgi:hypothetical protein